MDTYLLLYMSPDCIIAIHSEGLIGFQAKIKNKCLLHFLHKTTFLKITLGGFQCFYACTFHGKDDIKYCICHLISLAQQHLILFQTEFHHKPKRCIYLPRAFFLSKQVQEHPLSSHLCLCPLPNSKYHSLVPPPTRLPVMPILENKEPSIILWRYVICIEFVNKKGSKIAHNNEHPQQQQISQATVDSQQQASIDPPYANNIRPLP